MGLCGSVVVVVGLWCSVLSRLSIIAEIWRADRARRVFRGGMPQRTKETPGAVASIGRS